MRTLFGNWRPTQDTLTKQKKLLHNVAAYRRLKVAEVDCGIGKRNTMNTSYRKTLDSNETAANNFIYELSRLLIDKDDNVYNIDGTRLFWRCLPPNFLSKRKKTRQSEYRKRKTSDFSHMCECQRHI
ncbi:uncharacterized protein LOC105663368 [Megachile rotundata]|uniref:uncharacterized protein LOC105663368 n=1 Tax=Megachile rotundata TaxID=143995 RepID=UPI000614E5AC|nr:PREDICTED: uncharacterized protein LOC105663368 [Megachile rotundata]